MQPQRDDRAQHQPDHGRCHGIRQPAQHGPGPATRVLDRVLDRVGDVRRTMHAHFMQPVQDDPAADPQHSAGADDRQEGQHFRHRQQQPAPDLLRHRR